MKTTRLQPVGPSDKDGTVTDSETKSPLPSSIHVHAASRRLPTVTFKENDDSTGLTKSTLQDQRNAQISEQELFINLSRNTPRRLSLPHANTAATIS